ncbi:MAG: response regulator [bacterium]|nr:response regulator [bacterium]MBK8128390.1 response regulator [bacterium]
MESLKKKVLVVDDDEVIRDLLINFLKFSGYEGIGAPNGQKALEMIIADAPDMIITDIHMPLMNGFQLLRAVKRINPDLPVIFITGFAHFRRFFADKTARADGFLEKPFSLEAIDGLVKKYL